MPAKDFEFKFQINNELYTKFRELRAARNTNTDGLLYNMLILCEKPKEYQIKYELNFKSNTMVKFSQRVSKQTYLEFRLLSAYFQNNMQALDYLIFTEKQREKDCRLGNEFQSMDL